MKLSSIVSAAIAIFLLVGCFPQQEIPRFVQYTGADKAIVKKNTLKENSEARVACGIMYIDDLYAAGFDEGGPTMGFGKMELELLQGGSLGVSPGSHKFGIKCTVDAGMLANKEGGWAGDVEFLLEPYSSYVLNFDFKIESVNIFLKTFGVLDVLAVMAGDRSKSRDQMQATHESAIYNIKFIKTGQSMDVAQASKSIEHSTLLQTDTLPPPQSTTSVETVASETPSIQAAPPPKAALKFIAPQPPQVQATSKPPATPLFAASQKSPAQATSQATQIPVHAMTGSQTKTFREPVTGMEFVRVPEGCFQMGSPPNELGRYFDEGPVHEVCVNGFWMGKYEVTNAEYRKFKPKHNSGIYKGMSLNADLQPAVMVSWNDAKEFAKWLSSKGHGRYRLPTEAEWEFAARAGMATSRYWGDNPDDACKHANVLDLAAKGINNLSSSFHNCDDRYPVTAPVGSLLPNAFGLYDLLGNAWEWVEDVYNTKTYTTSIKNNPLNMRGGVARVYRGGGWNFGPNDSRAARRFWESPGNKFNGLGFRLVREP